MTSITQNQRYIPHELNTKYYATKLYRNGYCVVVNDVTSKQI